jgi:hypothetical protein
LNLAAHETFFKSQVEVVIVCVLENGLIHANSVVDNVGRQDGDSVYGRSYWRW